MNSSGEIQKKISKENCSAPTIVGTMRGLLGVSSWTWQLDTASPGDTMVAKNELFTAAFAVTAINEQGKSFDKVSRIGAYSETYDSQLTLDINTEIYPISQGDNVTLLLAASLAGDGSLQDPMKKQSWTDYVQQQQTLAKQKPGAGALSTNLADQYDYVMYGKVYKFDDKDAKATVYASFGGLLMNLSGDYRYFDDLEVGMNVYLLLRK